MDDATKQEIRFMATNIMSGMLSNNATSRALDKTKDDKKRGELIERMSFDAANAAIALYNTINKMGISQGGGPKAAPAQPQNTDTPTEVVEDKEDAPEAPPPPTPPESQEVVEGA